MPRNVLLLVSSMGSGGAERVATNLLNYWGDQGDKVTLLITFSGRGHCFYSISTSVDVIYLADITGVISKGLLSYWIRFWALRKFIHNLRPDFVVSFLTNVNVATLLATSGLGCRVIVSERIHPPMMRMHWIWRLLRFITYPMASRVVMLTTESLQWLNENIPRANGVVIPNPVLYPLPTSSVLPIPKRFISEERRLLLAAGRLDVQKGFDLLLQAFAGIANSNSIWDLVILGDGAERHKLERQIIDLGLVGRIFLPGRAGNMTDWYERADLYVMSSRFEGFPNTLAEAMAHGCAVVSFDCDTGPRDIIRNGRDGLLVRPVGDVTELAKALSQLMQDDIGRKLMASQAIALREKYSIQKVMRMWSKTFEGLA